MWRLMTALFNVLGIEMEEINYSESELGTNLNELSHEIIRELYIAAKKVSVYSASHPLTLKAVGRPFFLLGKVFRFKKYFHLHVSSGNLYALNIKMRPSVFVEQILEYMMFLDIKDILFESTASVPQLTSFLDRFVRRLPTVDSQNLMEIYLEKNKIATVRVNSELGFMLFEKGRKFQGDVRADFSVRQIVGTILGDDFERLSDMLTYEGLDSEHYQNRFNHDYHPRLARYIIPEKISLQSTEHLTSLISERLDEAFKKGLMATPDSAPTEEIVRLQGYVLALNYHPDREIILNNLHLDLGRRGVPKDIYSEMFPQTSILKMETSEKIDQFLDADFSSTSNSESPAEFETYFGRLLRTGQQGKAKSVISRLMEYLASDNLDLRRHALSHLRTVLSSYRQLTGAFLLDHIIGKIDEYVVLGKETYEFADLAWEVSQICLAEKKYESLAGLCTILSKRCQQTVGVHTYDSFAVRKALADLNRREILNQLMWELVEGQNTSFPHIKSILVAIGSEEVAFALSSIISHQSRQVRQFVLKILAEMGKAAVRVFTRIMEDNANFEREPDKKELPDARWYVVRNSIFVLGALNDKDGCAALRNRISDSDTRVRREIISALEKIGGDEAIDLLMILAEDSDREIREAAIITIGLVGTAEIVPELIDLALRRNSEIVKIIGVLGKLGGVPARKFLSNVLIDSQMQSTFTSNRSSREELRLATIKALGKIGDKESLETIKGFTDNLSASQKIFFGGSKLEKAADDILNRPDK